MPKLVWSSSGDEISLIPCNREFYEYFVEQLNLFSLNRYLGPTIDHTDLFAQLNESLSAVNRLLKEKFKILCFDISKPNWHDQKLLNQLHRDWVVLHQSYPQISEICESIETGSSFYIYKLNKLIHSAEQQFDSFVLVNDTISIPNKFKEDLTMLGVAGLVINYNNLGRSTFNKWINFDIETSEIDTNDFKEIYTELTMSLARPRVYGVPEEFGHSQPRGDRIGLANFDKLEENLLNYRQLVYKNFKLESNFIELH